MVSCVLYCILQCLYRFCKRGDRVDLEPLPTTLVTDIDAQDLADGAKSNPAGELQLPELVTDESIEVSAGGNNSIYYIEPNDGRSRRSGAITPDLRS